MEDLSADIAELRELLTAAKRPNVQNYITSRISILEKQAEERNAASTAAATPQSVPAPLQTTSTTAPRTSEIFTPISNYAWDQQGKSVKIYISLNGVSGLTKDNVQVEFGTKSLDAKIRAPDGRNYRLAIKNLCKAIVPADSTYRVKSAGMSITLRKKEETHWDNIHEKESKLKDTLPKGEDPSAGIMNLMKNLYDEGDDEMKRMIAKSWTEAREKKGDLPL
eukprot:GILK01004204.1.p1 GENE.GILK01004204.1~~GILK01004204.1.p1  ORF type:complete len:222 (-),score=37.90 GILK01004204.1:108-773(-)